MNLLSIYQKDKTYIFKSFDNDKFENPAKVIFKRFPFSDELFPVANQKNIMDSKQFKDFENTSKAKEQLIEFVINTMIDNITANRINYELFLKECISHFENLEFENKEIKTVNEFLSLPQDAIYKIAVELFLYSKTEDKFSVEQKKS